MKYLLIVLIFFSFTACQTEKDTLAYELASHDLSTSDLHWTNSDKNGVEFGSYALKKTEDWLYAHGEGSDPLYGLFFQNASYPEISFQMQVSPYPFPNEHKTWHRNLFGLNFAQTPCVDAWACFVMEAPQENLEIRLYRPEKKAILDVEDLSQEEKLALKNLFDTIYMRF